ncbi:TPA: hypothetical protein N0F65_004962, partial [Lagenidium giganteum]
VSALTAQRHNERIREGIISPKAHVNQLNKHASKVDLAWLVKWFTKLAVETGEVVPVRVHTQRKVDGVAKKYYSSDKYIMPPPYFTWERLY